jgi:D-serine dehydratase
MMKTATGPNSPIERLRSRIPFLWINDRLGSAADILPTLPLSRADIEDAAERLSRFAPLIVRLFPETEKDAGIIESELMCVGGLKQEMSRRFAVDIRGELWLKADHALPVAGSVKARGGVYEVLVFAETLAMREGLLTASDSYLRLASPEVRKLFSRHTIAVGSTGNLGLSIGIMGIALGFSVTVHMSKDAKQWKKELLRQRGVTVIEHESDYTSAVMAGREAAAGDPFAYFVDDESSASLFLGYSVAALRLAEQLRRRRISVNERRPLFVYIPCGVGGAPGGIAFGLKHVFGDHVHCFFAEPTDSPSFLLGMLSGFERPVSVYDVGLSNDTQADGLAVPAASLFAGKMIGDLVSGCLTVTDDSLFRFVYALFTTETIAVEPSAAAGFAGPLLVFSTPEGKRYLQNRHIADFMDDAIHLLWTTGGLLVPAREFETFRLRGERIYTEATEG